jgi:hypothetical protein
MTALLALVAGTLPTVTMAASGSGGGGGGTGGGGGGVTATGVVAYSNFGPVDPASTANGWGLTGLQAGGFFDYFAVQFTPAVSGTASGARLPLHKVDTGGNGQFTIRIFTDNPSSPNTLGTLIGSLQGQSASGTSTTLATASASNGPMLVAGQPYWAEVVPSSQSREVWHGSPIGITGNQLYIDVYQAIYDEGIQGAIEITVLP